MGTETPDVVTVVEKRLDFLERLSSEPLRKHELVDALGYSRSTVNRAIDDLEAEALVARETEGYRTTLTGRLLAESYRTFLETAVDVDGARSVLEPLRADADLSPAALRDAETVRAAGPDPYRPLERIDAGLRDAGTVRAVLPALPYPRLLERCREVLDGGGTVDLVVDERLYTHARERFPDELAGLARRDGFTATVVDRIDVGVLAADDTTLTVVFADDGGVYGITESTAASATAWAADAVRSLQREGTDVVDDFRTLHEGRREPGPVDEPESIDGRRSAAGRGAMDGPAGDRTGHGAASRRGSGPGGGAGGLVGSPGDTSDEVLSAQGFATVDDERLAGSPRPDGPLRTDPTFAEVAAGYVLDREAEIDGERRSLADTLIDGLAAGTDHALIGPPGCGKSTVCRTVAVRWHESGRGPVLYRASDAGETFRARETLRERLQAADGHALVVVEDAVRPDAASAVAVAREFADATDVSFLFDAREDAYDDPDDTPLTPADLAYRRRSVEVVRMPPLDEREVRRLVRHVTDQVGGEITADPGELLSSVRDTDAGSRAVDPESADPDTGPRDADAEQPGELLLLLHRIDRALDPVSSTEGSGPATGLAADVADAVAAFADRPAPTLDVATLGTLLSAADVGGVREYAHALAGEGDDLPSHDAVRRALDRLEGRILFPTGDGRDRTVHEEWSVLFLEQLLRREPEPVAAKRVGRVLTRLFGLADDPARRERIRREFGGDAARIDAIERDPEGWATATVRSVYDLGRTYPRLAALYGRTTYSWIALPDACPARFRDRQPEWVAWMHLGAGDVERAARELDAWRPTTRIGEARRQRLYGTVARRRGDYDDATEHFERAATLFAELDDRAGETAALRGVGKAAHFRGAHAEALDHCSRAFDIARRADEPIEQARALMDIANALDAMEGSDAVVAHYHAARRMFRAYDVRSGEANALTNLCVALNRRGDPDAADYGRRALEIYRTLGDELRESACLLNLGAIAEQRGDLEESAACFREARTIADRIGADLHGQIARHNLGTTALAAGDLDAAADHLHEALERARRMDNDDRVGTTLTSLAEVACEREVLSTANEHLSGAAAALEGSDNRQRLAELARVRGRVARQCDDYEAAADALGSAVEHARTGGFRPIEAAALAEQGRLALDRDDRESAVQQFSEALSIAREAACRRTLAEAAEALASLHEAAGCPDEAERCRDIVTESRTDGDVVPTDTT